MKKIIIDDYEITVENGVFTNAIYRDFNGKKVEVELNHELEMEFIKRRREEFHMIYERRKHINVFITDKQKQNLIINQKSLEDEVVDKNIEEKVIREIWKLPSPQNKRVFMKLINNYSLTKIAKIEGVSVAAIKYSIDKGIESLRKKLKNFKKF